MDGDGEIILYEDQDSNLWNQDLIEKGMYFLTQASTGNVLSKYHIEAAIAHWHTHQKDSSEKWEEILQLYNKLLVLEYSPVAALNRTFALAKANGREAAIVEAEKLNLVDNHLYHTLLGNLHMDSNPKKALEYFEKALNLAKTTTDKNTIIKNISKLQKDL
jgi:RNA polymerase sigma-70 factor (ECF subfamily)